MTPIIRHVARKAGFYDVDQYGVRNYKTRFLSLLCVMMLSFLVLMFGFVTYLAEMNTPGSTITSYSDAIWMMLMSATTIGFGDHYPVTLIGRAAVILMFVFGFSIFGGMGALIAGKVLGFTDTRIKNRELRKQNDDILRKLEHLDRELRLIKRMYSGSK